uniref:Uncharacterized protein n=1 Tax=Rhizophora mucronata TaxID=61149 RepID=A0A2P2NCW0_RHIMU
MVLSVICMSYKSKCLFQLNCSSKIEDTAGEYFDAVMFSQLLPRALVSVLTYFS